MLRRSSVACKPLLSSMICTEWQLVKSQLASCAVYVETYTQNQSLVGPDLTIFAR